MYVRWLDEIEDFRFDVTLSCRCFSDGDGSATSTGEPDAESQQELVSRSGRDAPAPAVLAAFRARWATTRCVAAVAIANVQGGGALPPNTILPRGIPGGKGANLPRCWYVHRARRRGASARYRHNGCPVSAVQRRPWVGSSTGTECPSLIARTRPGVGRFWYVAAFSIAAAKAKRTGTAFPPAAGCWMGQDVDVAEYVRSSQTCQRTKAEHGGPPGLLHHMGLPSRRGGMIEVD